MSATMSDLFAFGAARGATRLLFLGAPPVAASVARSSRAGGAGRREHIGNAIPPPTAEAIAREVAATLRSTSVAGFLLGPDTWVQPEGAPIVDAKLAPLMKAWANLNTGRDLGGILGA